MIPKKIHYCWFGGKDLPPLAKKCIASWKKYCPDYEIIEWNEKNFDININKYTKEAYENKKYAFVSDVARLYALYNYGGVYMDTDVELVKNIDIFLSNEAFSGFEAYDRVPTGIMAAEKHNKLFKKFLDYYNDKSFINDDGSYNMTTNVTIITNELENYGLKKNNTLQSPGGFTLYPVDYFCPFNFEKRKLEKTNNTYAIHWFNGSWVPRKEKYKVSIYRFLKKIFGEKNLQKFTRIIHAKRK